MEAFEIRKANRAKLDGDGLKNVVAQLLPGYEIIDGRIVIRFGALQPMTVWLDSGKLCVEIVTDKNVDSETVLKSISMRNRFLEAVTGYNSKERLKKLKKGDG
jgi:hypothetical protein